jgi:hypothetical protein
VAVGAAARAAGAGADATATTTAAETTAGGCAVATDEGTTTALLSVIKGLLLPEPPLLFILIRSLSLVDNGAFGSSDNTSVAFAVAEGALRVGVVAGDGADVGAGAGIGAAEIAVELLPLAASVSFTLNCSGAGTETGTEAGAVKGMAEDAEDVLSSASFVVDFSLSLALLRFAAAAIAAAMGFGASAKSVIGGSSLL